MARQPQPPWLHAEVARRMAQRLRIVRLQPATVLEWWGHTGASGGAAGRGLSDGRDASSSNRATRSLRRSRGAARGALVACTALGSRNRGPARRSRTGVGAIAMGQHDAARGGGPAGAAGALAAAAGGRRIPDVLQPRSRDAARIARVVPHARLAAPRARVHRHARSRGHAGARRLCRPGDGPGDVDAHLGRAAVAAGRVAFPRRQRLADALARAVHATLARAPSCGAGLARRDRTGGCA